MQIKCSNQGEGMCEVPDALTTGKADKDAKMLPVDGIKITRVQQERIDSDDLGMKTER
jgi:hypothetical protein